MIRVLHLIKSMGRGGAEMLLAEGFPHGDRRRFEYRYAFFVPWKNEMAKIIEDQGAKVACLKANRSAGMLLSVRRVANLIRDWEVDIVHCHLPMAGVVGRLASRTSGVPLVYTEHNKMERYHPLTRRANILTWEMQAGAIAVSQEVKDSIDRHTESEVPVHVVLNGIDSSRYRRDSGERKELRGELGIPEDVEVVGTVAVFRQQKRLDQWLEAAALVARDRDDVHFLLVGDGPLRDDLQALGESLGLTEKLHFPGLQQDVRPFLEIMDVFVMSSEFEGLPLALLEAMAMSCVVIATEVGGIPEVIRSGTNGYLTKVNDPEALGGLILRVLQNVDDRSRIQTEARQTIKERFGIAEMVANTEAIYESILSNGG